MSDWASDRVVFGETPAGADRATQALASGEFQGAVFEVEQGFLGKLKGFLLLLLTLHG